MNERLDPEQVQEIMSRIKNDAVRIVESHGGIVNQFVGDEVVALFGIPAGHEDDPVRSVRAALELHEAVRNLSTTHEARIGKPLRMHTGINTGLIVTHLEDARDGRYGLTGDTVNTAARLLSKAEADQILVSPDTHRLIAAFIETQELAPVEMKGKAEPLTPYRVVGKTRVLSRFEAAEQRGLTRFSGREAELATLSACLERTLRGQEWFVSLVGEAGAGKSRLLHEFRRSLAERGVQLLQGRCLSHGIHTPYLPWLDLLRRSLDLRAEDTADLLRKKALAGFDALGVDFAPHIPLLLHVLSIQSEHHRLPEGLEGAELGHALRQALAAFLRTRARRGPAALVLEDWHWADQTSRETLHHLLAGMGEQPLLVIVLYRPEFVADWRGLTRHTHLELAPLAAEKCAAIVRFCLDTDALPEGLAERIYERTGGNPFFIEELCRALVEDGTLLVADGRVQLSGALEQLHLPATVQAVIQARLDRLEQDVREAARLAAVIGREFARRLLERIHTARAELNRSLEELKSLEIIFQTQSPPGEAYQFKHALTQQVTYETLLLKRRKELHRLVGRAIEALYEDNLRDHYEELAHHYSQSDDLTSAAKYLWKAVNKAFWMLAIEDGYKLAGQGVQLLMNNTLSEDSQREGFITLALAWKGLSMHGISDEHIAAIQRARQVANDIEDHNKRIENIVSVNLSLSDIEWSQDRLGRAIEINKESFRLAKEVGRPDLGAGTLSTLAQRLIETGLPREGLSHLEQAITLSIEKNYRTAILENKLIRIEYLIKFGRLEESSAEIDAIERQLEDSERSAQIGIWLLLRKCELHSSRGEWQAALDRMDEVRALQTKQTIEYTERLFGGRIAYLQFMNGNPIAGFQELRRRANVLNDRSAYLDLAGVSVLLCDRQGSRAALARVEELTPAHLLSGEYHEVLSLLNALEEDWENAQVAMDKALQYYRDRDYGVAQSLGQFRLAEILHKKGESDAALQQLDEVSVSFRDKQMNWWLAQAEGLRERIERGEPWRGYAPYADGPPKIG
jgi:class 3 adenylate cyclase